MPKRVPNLTYDEMVEFEEAERKISQVAGDTNTKNKDYVHGDSDGDGIANIDDRYPFDSDRKKPVADASLSLELKKMGEYSKAHKQVLDEVRKDVGAQKARLKQPYSMIQKLNKAHMTEKAHTQKEDSKLGLTDVAGVMVIKDTQKEVHDTARKIKKKYNVVKENNYFKDNKEGETPKSGKNDFYHARHFVIKKDGKYIEIQVKTKAQKKLHDKQHLWYKQGLPRPGWMKVEALRLAKEGKEAMKQKRKGKRRLM